MTVDRIRTANSFVGSPIERIEDLRFLRGRGRYVDDVSPPGLLHAVILRTAIAHGRIRRIAAAAALSRPGVHAVITAADIGNVPTIPLRQEQLPAFTPFEQPVIADGKVRYVGEPVAVVVAETAAGAEDAAEAVAVDVEELPVVADCGPAESRGTTLFGTPSNLAGTLTAVKGDAEAALRAAPYTRREQFRVQRHTAVPMEPRGLVAEWQDGRLTLFGAAKVPFPNRRILAKQMGLPEDAIRMVENDIGGGFGVRGEFYPEDFLIPFAARFVGRPVKWIEDRREHLIATNHARDVACTLEVACDRDGTIRALRGHASVDVGAYIRTNGATGARNTAQILSGPYRVPSIRMEVSLHVTNKTPVGTYRGPGRFEADFFRERLFDMAAGDLGIDRVEFRRRNLIAESEMPYALAKVVELDLDTATDSGDYRTTLERCLKEIGWAVKTPLQGRLIDGRYHGLAIGCYFEGGASGPREHARLVLEADGTISVHVGSSANGQGLETAFAQIAADALEMPISQIGGVFHGSTDLLPEGFGTYSSRSIVMGGSAIVAAAGKLRAMIRAAAAHRLDCEAKDVEIVEGGARAFNKSVSLAELARQASQSIKARPPHSSPPPCGEGSGVGVDAWSTSPPLLPDPPPQLSPSRNRVYAGFGHPIKLSKSATADFDRGEGVATAPPQIKPTPTDLGVGSGAMGQSPTPPPSAEGGIAADGVYASPHRTYSYGAHAAHVAVDPRTGQVEVIDYVAVEDVGRVINPAMLHGQAVGAIVQGLGGTFLEHLVYDEHGQLLAGSLADYLMPTACDFPVVRTIALEEKPAPHNPLGAKGAGEGGIIPVGGVIANAVAAALRPLGVQPRELPLSPPKVWKMIEKGRAEDSSA
ncbi:MAG TPA: xanthine dehydrogenase family protein molybdopterin-binding subunit [Xanthobacteraceae bacterium]|nr:xanthine dehydrogenase family protein molybdopterin-binding subunit [Xanthobacteraceae bacterium]